MFDFEKLDVYVKSKTYNKSITALLMSKKLDRVTNNQLRRASFSIMLNIAEDSGRLTKPNKKHFYVIARGSVFECVAILDYLRDVGSIDNKTYQQYYALLEEIFKMLYALIKGLIK